MRIATALLLVLPALVPPTPAMGQEAAPITATGGFIALSVADLEASARWYADVLGLRRTMTSGRWERIAGVVVLEGHGLIVELMRHDDSVRPAGAPELAQGIMKAGAIVADFDGLVARLRRHRVELVAGPFPARPGARANVVVRDHAGNLLQFFGASPPAP